MRRNKSQFIVLFLALAISFPSVFAEPTFQVNSFSCSPSEAVINSVFSCTAQVYNSGTAGILSTVTLYPDATNWLESSNYPQSYGSSIGAGESASITFTGLRATKSGNNGFSKIMLDVSTDLYVATNNEKINIINTAVTISNSASSAAMGGEITATTEVTSGGDTDVSLTFTSSSGGCSIGSQTNPKSISGMTDGSKQSRTWTITQGTSGDCQFTVSAAATGTGGIASKIDSASSTITCTDCPTGGDGTSSSSGGGGGAGGGSKTYQLGELTSTSNLIEFSQNEKISFNLSGKTHLITLINSSETTATITIESKKQTFKLTVGDEIKVDLNEDNSADISVKLKSVNIITKKVSLVVSRISGGVPSSESGGQTEAKDNEEEESKSPFFEQTGNRMILWGALLFFVVLAAILLAWYIKLRKKRKKWGYV